jgi:protein-disulfide isomerase
MSIPIPHRVSGFILGAPEARAKIDVFFDIQCPHSKRAWPTIVQILNHYESKPVSVTAHLITLSNHRQAWDISLGLFALAKGDANRFYGFTTFLMERQEQYYNVPFRHKTHEDLRQLITDFANEYAGLDRHEFLEEIDTHDVYIEARTPIRFAATRSVWATPTFFINNADDVPLNHDSSLNDWIAVIDPLLAD